MRTEVQRDTVTTWTFVGLDNFRRVFTDRQVREAARMTITFVLVAVTAEILLGLLLAFLFNREIYARGLLRAVIMLPIFATPVAVGYLFFTIFYEEGGPLGWTGIPFLSHPTWALISIIIVDIWQWTPFCFLVFLAALQGLPRDQIEAAELDTDSAWVIWREVVLPALAPVIVIVLLLRLAEALKVFDVVASLTVGGPGNATQSLSYLAFRTGLRFFDVGFASAISFTLLAVVMVIVTVLFKRIRRIYA
jgi:multiple sugar transport system permease protein